MRRKSEKKNNIKFKKEYLKTFITSSSCFFTFLIALFIFKSGCSGVQESVTSSDWKGSPRQESRVNLLDDIAFGTDGKPSTVDYSFKNPNKKVSSNEILAKTWKSSQLIPHTSKLSIGDKEHLPLKKMQFTVRVDGFRARVLLDCFYYNNQNSQLEGTFKLRLPNNASPYFLAFGNGESGYTVQDNTPPFISYPSSQDFSLAPEDIMKQRTQVNTKLKEARMVERARAAYAYKKPVVERRDPALMEWAGADVFNCRVYPLMPKTVQHIVIGYDINLTQTQQGKVFSLPIPETSAPMRVNLDLAVKKEFKPVLNFKTDSLAQEKRWKIQLENPKTQLLVQYPNENILLVDHNKPHWAASFPLDIERIERNSSHSKAVFLVDVSLSSNPDKFRIWLALMESILEKNSAAIKEFAVLFFNVETFWWQNKFVANNPAEVQKLMAFTDALCLEGATDLAVALKEASLPSWGTNSISKSPQLFFLLSDGAITWGEDELNTLSNTIAPHTLFGYQTGISGTDSRVLTHLASASGGAVFSVTTEDQVASASTAFSQQSWELVDMQLTGGIDLLMAGRPRYLYPGQSLLLTGRGVPTENSECILTLKQEGREQKVKVRFPVHLNSPLAFRCYGQVATNQLESFGEYTREASTSYSKYYRVPGQSCSLLMLETEDDYRRHQIIKVDPIGFIHNNYVNKLVNDITVKIGTLLGNPKENFKQWFMQLNSTPGVRFTFPAELNSLIQETTLEQFRINLSPLRCQIRNQEQIPSTIKKVLSQQELDAILLTEEAEKRFKKFGVGDSIKLLSSLVERNPGDSVLARDVAFNIMAMKAPEHSYYLLRRIIKERPYEPPTYYLMAQVLAAMEKYEMAILYYEIALGGIWESRFEKFNLIVQFDYLNFLNRLKKARLNIFGDYPTKRASQLKTNLPKSAELLVTILWNTDDTDVDLHVKEPNGLECSFENMETSNGGRLFQDVTGGYGPEMYLIPKAVQGEYEIKINYYSGNSNRLSTPTKVYAAIYINWGKENENVIKKVLTLSEEKEIVNIAKLKFGKN